MRIEVARAIIEKAFLQTLVEDLGAVVILDDIDEPEMSMLARIATLR
jgi:hypothetical protein